MGKGRGLGSVPISPPPAPSCLGSVSMSPTDGKLPEDRDEMLAQDSCHVSEDLQAVCSMLPSSRTSLATDTQDSPTPQS